MESKKNRQQKTMISSTKSKNKILLQEKKDTWGNILNKKCTNTNTIIGLNKKPHQNSSKNHDGNVKSKHFNVFIKII